MIRLRVHDRVRVIASSPERSYLLNQTGMVIAISSLVGDDNVMIKLDNNGLIGFLGRIVFNSLHTRNQLEAIEPGNSDLMS